MLSRLGEETINTPLYVQVDARMCHVMTEHLLRYVLVGEPSMAGKAVKTLRLAAFAPLNTAAATTPAARPIDYNVRVYFVEDTQDALEVSVIFHFQSCMVSHSLKMGPIL